MANNSKTILVQTATNVNMILNFGRNLSELIKNSDIDYHVIYSKNQNKTNEAVIANELKDLNATLHTIPLRQHLSLTSLYQLFLSFYGIYSIIKRVRPDIFYTRGTLMGIIGRLAAVLAGVEKIYHHQDDFYHREESLGCVRKNFYKTLEKILARKTTRLFFVSQTILKEAIYIGIQEDKCIDVGHDLHPIFRNNLDLPTGRSVRIDNYLGNGKDVFLVGTFSRIEDFKGIDTIIEVAKNIKARQKDIKFFIRGIGSKYQKYEDLIHTEDLIDTIYLTKDYLPTEEMPALFKSFDVFFLPTRREGFGMVFAEAMSMGVPVVCPKIYPVVEVVPADMGYVIEPEDIEGYTSAIIDLYNDDQKRLALASKARKYAIERWGGNKSARMVFDTLMN